MMHQDDEKLELKLISKLMEQLQGEMEYGEDDFMDRLGRKKPQVEMVKIEGKIPGEMTDPDESPSMSDMEDGFEDEDPEESLKRRLMQLRG